MDIPPTPDHDPLAQPVATRLFQALVALRRPASTRELAEIVGRHPNTARVQLGRLADAGLIERRRAPQPRGRPREEWAVEANARPAGRPPSAHGQLAGWLARAIGRGTGLEAVERGGREIGREIAPAAAGRSLADAMHDALTALGFAPRREPGAAGVTRYVLGNCPYREAVAQNPPLVCGLHRGITVGLIDSFDASAKLAGFVARDPDTAGCLIEVEARA
jgi:predicted ArsR family transcriptional regulator